MGHALDAAKWNLLDRVEEFLVSGQARYTRAAFARKARALRQELPAHYVVAFDEIKA